MTGASSGIGLALAEVLAREGHDLVLTVLRVEAMEASAQGLRQRHGAKVVGACAQAILVNNAGVGAFKDTLLAPDEAMLQPNMTSLVGVSKRFLPGVIAQRLTRET